MFSSEDEDIGEDAKEKSAPLASCELETDSNDAKEKTWTSLQYAEAISVLSTIMKNPSKKCTNCGKSNPKISSPTFGWLNKVLIAILFSSPDDCMRFWGKNRETSIMFNVLGTFIRSWMSG